MRIVAVLSFVIALLTAPTAAADDLSHKLQPLPYNNPGLEVDLGVGLWAYPMPLDYDNDGDMDLLVSCPDKPSNGVYFFENPTQDATVAAPVFKPGVRVGDGRPYMMLSHVGDEAVVLAPGKLFRRNPSTGKFDFGAPESIDASHNHSAGVRGDMWRLVDFDGDGDHDIIAGVGDWSEYGWDHAYNNRGEWRNGPLHGYVYLISNDGDDESPRYSHAPRRLKAADADIDVYGWPCPSFADFDGDGDLDLICGEFLDGFNYFQNVGIRTSPEYAAGVKLRAADGEPLAMHVQMITPTAVDWDGDGDTDLVVGDEDGRVALVENTGELRGRVPVFAPPRYFRQQADTLKFGALATPYVYDWDGDGDDDILCGNTAGSIGFFENLGDADNGLPIWDAPKLLHVHSEQGTTTPFRVMAGPSGSIQGPCEAKWGYTTFSVADWDNDGDGDILYNSILARLGLLTNDGGVLTEAPFDTGLSEAPPVWYGEWPPSTDTLTQWRTTPLAIDFDDDGRLDLVMLDQQGYLTLRRPGGPAERVFVDEQLQPLQLNPGTCGRSGRVKLATVDWDNDGRLDLLVNSDNAMWYRNCAMRDGKIVLKRVGNLAKRNVAGHTSSPAVCDFDRDGKPDLLVGSENGRIYHIAHDDCVQYAGDQLVPNESRDDATPRLPGLVREEFLFEQAPFEQCHASTICQTTRGLVASWFGGTKEGNEDVTIWTSYHDGLRWSAPTQAADGVQHDSLRYPCWNPVLFQPPGDAPTLLFFKVGPNPREWWGEVMVSYDRGRTFVERRRLPEGILGPVRCKPLLLDDGETLLCGSSTEHDGWRVHFEIARIEAGLLTGDWRRIGPINDATNFSAIQPTFLIHPDGRLQTLVRTKEDVIASSDSEDEGRSWSSLEATELPNPNSGIESVTLADGRHLLVYNPLGSGDDGWGKRSVLSLAVSTDGRSWTPVGDLERAESGEFSYPAMIQADDGLVHVTYTWNRQRIKHIVLDASKL